ncbi:hypothetical protein EUX98_g3363 [Antrodiella citrinella]|uniref:Uncharacterized protein n=1 Tax=Antrodiella citrinella TaxID=2447956 RepID=A0A4S4MWR7_9APHY|nr:hypothetical protein EUX98_g3363 [Antrodiella citrinella]
MSPIPMLSVNEKPPASRDDNPPQADSPTSEDNSPEESSFVFGIETLVGDGFYFVRKAFGFPVSYKWFRRQANITPSANDSSGIILLMVQERMQEICASVWPNGHPDDVKVTVALTKPHDGDQYRCGFLSMLMDVDGDEPPPQEVVDTVSNILSVYGILEKPDWYYVTE